MEQKSNRISRYLNDILVGFISGAQRIVGAATISSLLFPGELSQFFAVGFSIGLASVFWANLLGAIRSSMPFMLYATSYLPLIFIAQANINIYQIQGANGINSMLILLLITTIGVGITFFLFGKMNLSRLIYHIPSSITAGFMGGIGLLFASKGYEQLVLVQLSEFWTKGIFIYLLPVLFISLYFLFKSKLKKKFSIPLLIVGYIICFHIILYGFDINFLNAQELKLLLSSSQGGYLYLPFQIEFKGNISEIFDQLQFVLLAIFVSLLGVIFQCKSLSTFPNYKLDINRELKIAGLAGISTGFLGGSISFQSFGNTKFLFNLGVRSQIATLITALFAGLLLYTGFGGSVIAFIPYSLISNLLIILGIEITFQWLIKPIISPPINYFESIVILSTSISLIVFGFVKGIFIAFLIYFILRSIFNTDITRRR